MAGDGEMAATAVCGGHCNSHGVGADAIARRLRRAQVGRDRARRALGLTGHAATLDRLDIGEAVCVQAESRCT